MEAGHAPFLQYLSDAWSWLGFQFAKLRWGQTNLRQYILWAMVPVLLVLLFQIVFQSRRQQRRALLAAGAGGPGWPGLDSEFYQLERRLAVRGLARLDGEALGDWLKRGLKDPGLAGMGETLQTLLRLHYRYRFDPEGLSRVEREQLRQEARVCLEQVETA